MFGQVKNIRANFVLPSQTDFASYGYNLNW